MANINSNPTFRGSVGYRDFKMDQHLEFSSTVAQLLPVYYDVLSPGDKVHASAYMKTRTMPLESAAFARINEHLEWFFVPLHQLYKPFGAFYYGIQDLDSSMYEQLQGYIQGGQQPAYNDKRVWMSSRFPYIKYERFLHLCQNFRNSLVDRTLMNEQVWTQMCRLMSHLGINEKLFMEFTSTAEEPTFNSFSFTPLLACAYQKIFMDHYRDSDRLDNDPACYSLDIFFEQLTDGDIIDYVHQYKTGEEWDWIKKFFTMRYRPIKKDFMTNLFPMPVFGASSASAMLFQSPNGTNTTLQKVNQWLTNLGSVNTRTQGSPTNTGTVNPVDGGTTSVIPNRNTTSSNALNISEMNQANIRALFATDKLLEVTRRSGKHYDAQTLAHFGVNVPDTIEGQSFRLGGSSQQIVIGDVVSTSNTDDGALGSPLGEVAGKGYGASGHDRISFQAPCHGVLMCIYSAAPVLDYYQQGLDKLNTLIEKSDWFVPEFDNLGMQPMFQYQTNLQNGAQGASKNAQILGWQYRYMELKQKINRIIGALQHTQKHWTVGRNSSDVGGTSANKFYHDPASLNSIVEYDYLKGFDETGAVVATASELYERDPLIHEVQFDVTKASKMSTYGLMEL